MKSMYIFRLWRKHVQSSKKISIKLYQELCSWGTHYLYIEGEKWLKFTMWKKEKKKIIEQLHSKPYTHPYTMK